MKRYKRHNTLGLFDQDFRLTKLSKLGDPLEKLAQGVDFEIFRKKLEEHLIKPAKGKGGRPPYDFVLMFKILILQRYYNLSDDQVEFQVNDRITFMRFLNLTIADDVPDSKTVWHFKEQLIDLELIEPLFNLFLDHLTELGMVVNEGKIVDASFIEVPKQRNSKDENKLIKEGKTPESFEKNKHKKSHKDIDAQWVKKGDQNYFGYKNHVKTDSKSKIITGYKVTSAKVHDSQPLKELIDERDAQQPLYADSAYTGENQEAEIISKKMTNQVCEKGLRNKPLTEEQKANNKIKSKTRCRVEHIFGFMEMSMNGMYMYSVGKKRITGNVGLVNLTYNMFRKIQLQAI